MESDLLMLPPTHTHTHILWSFLPSSRCPASSSAGGVVLAVHRSLAQAATETRVHTHMRGRAITASLRLNGRVHLASVQPFPFAQKRRLLLSLSEVLRGQTGNFYMTGDWNFVVADEARISGIGGDIAASGTMSTFFDHRFQEHIELVQRDHTFRRFAREEGGQSVFSRFIGCMGWSTRPRSKRSRSQSLSEDRSAAPLQVITER